MNSVQSTDSVKEQKQTEGTSRLNSGRVHVPLKVLLAEASLESKEKRPSTKERVLSFRRRVSKDDKLVPKTNTGTHLPSCLMTTSTRGPKQGNNHGCRSSAATPCTNAAFLRLQAPIRHANLVVSVETFSICARIGKRFVLHRSSSCVT